MEIFLIVAVLVVIAAIALIVLGIRAPESDDANLQQRLADFTARGEVVNLEELEMSQPFRERIILPMARKFGQLAARFTPQNVLYSIEHKLELAGNPGRLDPTTFLALQFVAMLVFGGMINFFLLLGGGRFSPAARLGMGLLVLAVAFYLPSFWLSTKISNRQKNIRRALPDALDLLTICVEAGLGFDSSMHKVVEKWESDLSVAFSRVLREIQLGKLRRDALRDMADRVGIPELTSFVAAVIQSEQLGVSMAKVLRIQSDQMRLKRRQYAEEQAHKAPIKMLLPMAFLIFPSLMIVLLTPAALRLMQSALGNMFF